MLYISDLNIPFQIMFKCPDNMLFFITQSDSSLKLGIEICYKILYGYFRKISKDKIEIKKILNGIGAVTECL